MTRERGSRVILGASAAQSRGSQDERSAFCGARSSGRAAARPTMMTKVS
jgi:hypothetical protein